MVVVMGVVMGDLATIRHQAAEMGDLATTRHQAAVDESLRSLNAVAIYMCSRFFCGLWICFGPRRQAFVHKIPHSSEQSAALCRVFV